MENLVKIAEGVLTSCLAVKPGEEILVITDDSRKEIGEAIYEAAGNLGAISKECRKESRSSVISSAAPLCNS